MDWTNLTFLLGNIVGVFVKRQPNSISMFRDKLIPYWIFASQMIAQFIAGLALPAQPTAFLGDDPTFPTYAMAGLIGGAAFWHTVWKAVEQTAIAILLNQLKKQATKKA